MFIKDKTKVACGMSGI